MEKTRAYSVVLQGFEVHLVTIEVAFSSGIPGISIVGTAEKEVLDSRTRLRCAFRALGFEIPRCHITINISSNVKLKNLGRDLDLAIAVAILHSSHQIKDIKLDKFLFLGALSLSGEVEASPKFYLTTKFCNENALSLCCATNKNFSVAFKGVVLQNLLDLHNLSNRLGDINIKASNFPLNTESAYDHDFKNVYGQELAKRALMIATVGKHALLMSGAAGSGKTALARCLPSIHPSLDEQDANEIHSIYSVAGRMREIKHGSVPFRNPHYSITSAGLLGSIKSNSIGELTLAHKGILFLDELGEYSPRTLATLRQPVEDKCITLNSSGLHLMYPCDLQLICATNPCPCGNLGNPHKKCVCSGADVMRYQKKLKGPLFDRIDLALHIAYPEQDEVIHESNGLDSAQMKRFVDDALYFRDERLMKYKRINGTFVEQQLFKEGAIYKLSVYARNLKLSARGIKSVIKVARSIADLEQSLYVSEDYLVESLGFRVGGVIRDV